MTDTTFDTIDDVISLNRSTGHHFFDPDTMRFFNSRIETELMRGRFFVTSEQGPHMARAYTVRVAGDDGDIGSVGEGFMGYGTLAEATDWIEGDN